MCVPPIQIVMRQNWNTMIEGVKVILVPYKKGHVQKYHGWMKSKELQELTGSEPLSLGSCDLIRVCFAIKLHRDGQQISFRLRDLGSGVEFTQPMSPESKIYVAEEEYKMQETWRDSVDKCTFIVLDKDLLESYAFDESDEIASMVGDTNLFISGGRDDDGGGEEEKVAEAEIMIAEEASRGKGLGKEAMALMLNYGARKLGVGAFEARIKVGVLGPAKEWSLGCVNPAS